MLDSKAKMYDFTFNLKGYMDKRDGGQPSAERKAASSRE